MHFLQDFELRPFNTFGIDAKARLFTSFSSVVQLQEILQSAQFRSNSRLVLGGGSNILLTKDFDGLVLRNEVEGVSVENEDEEHVFVKTGAGENWHRFVLFCVQNNFAGVENLSLIPGNTGASPMQNIGAYGVEIKDVFHELEAVHIPDGSLHRFTARDCAFGYRESVFKNKLKGQFIITSVVYRLNKKPVFHTSYGAIQQELDAMGVTELSIQAISQAVINIRSSKLPDPKEIGNAGSFFKNPMIAAEKFASLKQQYQGIPSFPADEGRVKVPAGWLIEQCGWKGYRNGDAGCYPKQALVLVNYGNASGIEVYQLSEEIIASVLEKFGVQLEREVNIF
jgi:UDP-N-acetylmuramate dehydrogenase